MTSWSLSTPSSSLPVVDDIGSRILSESFPSPDPIDDSFHLQDTGPGGADLSLSELSLSDKPFTRDGPRFSLLAPQPAPSHPFSSDQSAIAEVDEYVDGTGATADMEEDVANTAVLGRAVAAKAREEKLQRDLFILKKLNSSFSVLNDALSIAKSATEVWMRVDGLLSATYWSCDTVNVASGRTAGSDGRAARQVRKYALQIGGDYSTYI